MSDKKCDLCDNPAMHIHAKCHITAPLRAEIDGTKLTLYCYVPECGRKVAQFEIDKDFYELYLKSDIPNETTFIIPYRD